MGAGQSKPETNEQVVLSETPIQFSQDVVNHLADVSAGPTPSPERQSSIDAHIRGRIQAEISRLKQEEEDVRRQIETSLEKENLEHETRGLTGKEGEEQEIAPSGGSQETLNSTILLGDVEEVRQKAAKYHQKREEEAESPAIQAANSVLSCYKNNLTTPLDCWKEVSAFRANVAKVEKDFVSSFR